MRRIRSCPLCGSRAIRAAVSSPAIVPMISGNEALSNAYRRVDGETRKQLVMPWHAGHGATEAEYAAYRKARRTMTEINKMGGNVYRDPAMQAVREKVVAARRRGDIAEVKRLLEEQKTVQIKRERELVEGLRSQVPGKLDGAVLEAALAAPATQPLAYQWEMPAEVETRLGYLGSGADEARRTAPMGGWARANGLYIDVSLTLADVAHGAPAVAAWLKERGVIDMRYDVYEPVGARDLAEDPELQ